MDSNPKVPFVKIMLFMLAIHLDLSADIFQATIMLLL